ncbi:HD domain-containing protein, putative [Eimeria acervulina]|uniref:HD domain-containing protein, putative n=1 Tax=Eimeria acervulina TaxID=5801 RepID=U6GXD6_EIMAC|nr:HD domain-containing protein, putative [Eimeria acervulina]CDI83918.1 HD domain-containing protein, putative [Eimeria acervulina]
MMAVVHDLAESIVGDITPLDPITPEEKAEKERNAIQSICNSLDSKRAQELIGLWEEYERGETPEAMLVKDADKLDMITQAFEYEKRHGVCLEEFFISTEKIFKTPAFKTLNENLRKSRSAFFSDNPKAQAKP